MKIEGPDAKGWVVVENFPWRFVFVRGRKEPIIIMRLDMSRAEPEDLIPPRWLLLKAKKAARKRFLYMSGAS